MDHKDAIKAVRKLVSKQAEASGRTVKRQGLQALVLQGIQEIKSTKK
jgi:hypothetical protein